MVPGRPSGPAARLLVAGGVLTFASSFGQNFYVAVFGGDIRAAYGLSSGDLAGLYTLATLAAAATLVGVGGLVDRFRVRVLAVVTLLLLAGAALVVGGTRSVAGLVFGLYGLRLLGQGMLSHLSSSSVTRWSAGGARGRALSASVLGNPIGEATLPLVAALLIVAVGWRGTWGIAAAFLVVVVVPTVLWLLRSEPARAAAPDHPAEAVPGWTRRQVLRDPRFAVVLPALLAPALINTSVFFHQDHLSEVRGWGPTWFVAWYPAGAAATVVAALVAGRLLDRSGSGFVLRGFLLPLLLGLALMTVVESRWAVPVYLVLAGLTMGAVQPLLTVLCADLYGTGRIGAVRSLVVGGTVVAGAVGPSVVGWSIDRSVPVGVLFALMAACTLIATTLVLLLRQIGRS